MSLSFCVYRASWICPLVCRPVLPGGLRCVTERRRQDWQSESGPSLCNEYKWAPGLTLLRFFSCESTGKHKTKDVERRGCNHTPLLPWILTHVLQFSHRTRTNTSVRLVGSVFLHWSLLYENSSIFSSYHTYQLHRLTLWGRVVLAQPLVGYMQIILYSRYGNTGLFQSSHFGLNNINFNLILIFSSNLSTNISEMYVVSCMNLFFLTK